MLLARGPALPCAMLAASLALGCASEESSGPGGPSCGDLAVGDSQGHADPFGAKAAGQARAGRIADAGAIAQPAHGRQQIEDGDFVLVNDQIAVVIEDVGLSDGYGRFGGEIIDLDRVGDDGRPAGESYLLETLMTFGMSTVHADTVSVLADGTDGGEAVVRAAGPMELIPFLDGPLSNLLPHDFDLRVAYDYVLAPGSERLLVRVNVLNPVSDPVDLGAHKSSSDELMMMFQTNRNQLVTPELGFELEGTHQWVGVVPYQGPWSFAYRAVDGPLEFGLEQSGFNMLAAPGYQVAGCGLTTQDRFEIIAGGPYYDGLRETIRRVDQAPAWRTISGSVEDADGKPMAGASVHELDADDLYLSRTRTGQDGSFTIHAPPDDSVQLVAQAPGYQHDAVEVPVGTDTVTLSFGPHALIHVTVRDAESAVPLPARVQIIPTTPPPATPEGWGVKDWPRGRLLQDFPTAGDATIVVPPGEHRVVVTRGYEYELHDETVSVAAGETATISATLTHSVDSTGVMCADFHIHSYMSADSDDTFADKVMSAVADGLEIPCSSEHDWVVDFGPVVHELGLDAWAFGMASSELTTFKWGHFGVVPLLPRPGAYNGGAIDWIDHSPAEVFAAVDALPEQPALVINHPRSGFAGYFASVNLDPDTAQPGIPELWSDNFDAVEVFNDASFDENRDKDVRDWFALLDAGERVFAVGSSDSHHIRSSPVGYARTCFYFGHDDPSKLTAELVRDALLGGDSVVSGGLTLTVRGPDTEHPGGHLAAGSRTFTVTSESPSWVDTLDLEIYVRGQLIGTETPAPLGPGPSNRYLNQITLDLKSGDWVVFHARGDGDLAPLHPGRSAFAVSNPIFVD